MTNTTQATETDTIESAPRVVVGVDGSESSKQALRWAARIAATNGAQIQVLGTWAFPVSYGAGPGTGDWNPEQDMDKCLTEAVDEVFGSERPAGLTVTVHEGGTAKALIEASEGALMLVVGSRGHGGFAGLLLGSVSASVAEHATCPVLVVHGDQIPA
jgi:nucleotide-binding universal stress UspA family protein